MLKNVIMHVCVSTEGPLSWMHKHRFPSGAVAAVWVLLKGFLILPPSLLQWLKTANWSKKMEGQIALKGSENSHPLANSKIGMTRQHASRSALIISFQQDHYLASRPLRRHEQHKGLHRNKFSLETVSVGH